MTAKPADKLTAADFLARIPSFPAGPKGLTTDPNLPACPLCQAPARAGYAYATYDNIVHECDCDIAHTEAYYAQLRRLYAMHRRLPDLLEQLPERFHDARASDFLGNPLVMALCAEPVTGYLYGAPGLGKTRLAAAAGIAAARKGVRVAYAPFNKLLTAHRDAVEDRRIRPDTSSPGLLILDDLGKFKATDFAYEVLYGIAEDRWVNGRPTIYTANHDAMTTARACVPATLFSTAADREAAAAALASRFSAGITYEVSGVDRRAGEMN